MSEEDEPLGLVPTDDLIEELQRRFPHSLFVGTQDLDEEYDRRVLLWRGNRMHVVGLLAAAQHRIIRQDYPCDTDDDSITDDEDQDRS